MTAIQGGLVGSWVLGGDGNVSWWESSSIRLVAPGSDAVDTATLVLFTAPLDGTLVAGSDFSLVVAVVVAVTARAGVVYSSVLQRRTGRETVREARKAAEAALASAGYQLQLQ